MRTASKSLNSEHSTSLIEARVTGVCDGVLGLGSAWGAITARRAASCLLEPAAGDTVLATRVGADSWYVIAVLTRGESVPVVSLPADSQLRSVQGGLTVTAHTGLVLAAGEQLSITTPSLEVQAETAHGSFSVLRTAAGLIEATATRMRNVADLFETVAEVIRQRAGSSFREVQDLDHLKAGQVYYKAESVLNMRGKHSVLSAEGEVKIDGTRVHLG
ncbi:MAG TPA: DUF3540 domain-containing protein [Gammaproteobacteria bacterium]|nr:DUF3540 domain-containing protein [Gammaproteobacteria bacterium]